MINFEFLICVFFVKHKISGRMTAELLNVFQSMALVRRYHFPSLFINQYYPRSGTPAAALPRVDAKEAKVQLIQ